MCGLASRLLAEKLIDDFYEEDVIANQRNGEPATDALTEELKSLLPTDSHALLFRWEAQCAETCEKELRRFARFVAGTILVATPCTEDQSSESGSEE